MVFLGGLRLTANCDLPALSVILMGSHLLFPGRRFRKVVTKLNCSGSPWLKIRRVGIFRLAVESIL